MIYLYWFSQLSSAFAKPDRQDNDGYLLVLSAKLKSAAYAGQHWSPMQYTWVTLFASTTTSQMKQFRPRRTLLFSVTVSCASARTPFCRCFGIHGISISLSESYSTISVAWCYFRKISIKSQIYRNWKLRLIWALTNVSLIFILEIEWCAMFQIKVYDVYYTSLLHMSFLE